MRTNKLEADSPAVKLLAWLGSAGVSIGFWAGIAHVGRLGWRWAMTGANSSNGILARLWGDCVWAWQVGNQEGWIGPLRWGIVASLGMTVICTGMAVWEWMQRRKENREHGEN